MEIDFEYLKNCNDLQKLIGIEIYESYMGNKLVMRSHIREIGIRNNSYILYLPSIPDVAIYSTHSITAGYGHPAKVFTDKAEAEAYCEYLNGE